MSDLLSGLWPGEAMRSTHGGSFVRGYRRALDDVREALRNPTNEQVDALVDAAWAAWDALCEPVDSDQMEHAVRAVLAAAAGGDR